MPSIPPGPGPSRVVNTWRFQTDPVPFLEGSRRRFGDVWMLRLVGHTDFAMVSDPKLVEKVFTADPTVLHTGSGTGKPVMGPRSAIILNERAHTEMRQVLEPFFRGESVQRYNSLTSRIAEEQLAGWPLNEPQPVLPLMQAITLNVIMSAVFGVTEADRQEALAERIETLIAWGSGASRMARMHRSQRLGKPPPKSLAKARDPLDEMVHQIIGRARQDPRLEERDDILALLIQARYEDGRPLTDGELRDHLVTLLIQGHASTADSLSWAIERLLRNPETHERLREEVRSNGEEYVDAVVKETLRVRPPLGMCTRLVNKPFELGEWVLEPGRLIAPCIYLVHHSEEIYPEPERFRPERFLEKPVGKYTWIPFGGGYRSCLGGHFAMHEIKTVLRTVMRQARFEVVDQADEPVRLRRVGMSPKQGAVAKLVERVPAAAVGAFLAAVPNILATVSSAC
jgi:cytochrome P450 family 135